MKVINLVAENFKRLSAVDITPTGGVVKISGRNTHGKTSTLDAIWAALQQSDAKVAMPIRKGQEKARVRVAMGTDKVELVVERKYTASGSTLKVTNADGTASFNSPQKMLDALIGELAFDPLSFVRMDARRQFDELRRVAKLEVDVDALTLANQKDFTARTEVNRQAKAKRTLAESIVVKKDLPAEPVDDVALLNQITTALGANAEIDVRRNNRANAADDIQNRKDRALEIRARAAELRRQAALEDTKAEAEEVAATALQKRLDEALPLPEPTDVTDLRTQLDAAKATNAAIEERATRARLEDEAVALEKKAAALTEAMATRDKQKTDAIAAAAMPVDGLGFGDGIVTFNGVPFDQASGAEQLQVSMALAMAANPKLRVIRISDGSLLDEDSMAVVTEMAKVNDFQVWVEIVDSSKKVGIVIEDGTVVAVNEEPAEAAA